jgi:hypothetical protein
VSDKIPASRRTAERLLLRAVKADLRRAVPGSVVLDGFALDWTERLKRNGDFYARSAYVDRQAVLDLLEADLREQR